MFSEQKEFSKYFSERLIELEGHATVFIGDHKESFSQKAKRHCGINDSIMSTLNLAYYIR